MLSLKKSRTLVMVLAFAYLDMNSEALACESNEQFNYCTCRVDGGGLSECSGYAECSEDELSSVESRLLIATCDQGDAACTESWRQKMCKRITAVHKVLPPPNFERGIDAFEKGDFGTALKEFQRLNTPMAHAYLGAMYLDGKGVEKDEEKAFQLMQGAAQQGYAPAVDALATFHENGYGTEVNYGKATALYKAAADKGIAAAQLTYGLIAWNGVHIPSDYTVAYKYLRSAAKAGSAEAQFQLARFIYDRDSGIPDSQGKKVVTNHNDEAFALFKKAWAGGQTGADYYIGKMYWSGVGVEYDEDEAIRWLTSAAEHKNGTAAYLLGALYQASEKMDVENAFKFYEIAGSLGDVELQHRVAENIRTLKHPQAMARGYHWYSKAAQGGQPDAALKAGQMARDGQGTREDPQASAQWFRIAAEAGREEARLTLAGFYRDGYGLEQDSEEAAKLYSPLAQNDHTGAQYELGLLNYEFEAGKAPTTSLFWMQKAARSGHSRAQEELGMLYYMSEGQMQNLVAAFVWLSIAQLNAQPVGNFFPDVLVLEMQDDELDRAQEALARCLRSGLENCRVG